MFGEILVLIIRTNNLFVIYTKVSNPTGSIIIIYESET